MAATIIMIINAYDLYRFRMSAFIRPILPNMKVKTGNWNTIPIMNDSVVKVEIYESRVIVLVMSLST